MYWKSHKMFLDHFQAYGLRSEALATSYAMAENVFAVTQGGINSPVKLDIIDQGAFLSRQTAEPVGETHNRENLWLESDQIKNPSVLKMLSAGKPIEDTNVRILDQQGGELPERHIGEIALQSNCILTGYYHRPDLTKKAILEGWYMTGDLGYLANGELYVTGRKKDLIIVGGKNIYPQDLEYLASEVEGIHAGRVAAFGVFNERTGTEDVVIVAEADYDLLEARQPGPSDKQDQTERIAAEIRETVTRGSDIALRYVHVVDRNWLLKTSSGKVARRANREKYLSEFSGV
jgi:acyl-CoA synthetase (AMP-forming)/AMP-acid ligase II